MATFALRGVASPCNATSVDPTTICPLVNDSPRGVPLTSPCRLRNAKPFTEPSGAAIAPETSGVAPLPRTRTSASTLP